MTQQTTAPKRVLVIISTMVAALVLLLPTAVGASGDDPAGIRYEVEAGDTLWDIAAEVTEAGQDVRATVGDIKRRNDLDSSLIVPGQVLVLPAASG